MGEIRHLLGVHTGPRILVRNGQELDFTNERQGRLWTTSHVISRAGHHAPFVSGYNRYSLPRMVFGRTGCSDRPRKEEP